eukprot:TRINITY_DN4249_c0_g1_i1.p1 TRINITY_DN4249_c0_g1~~TRINITY_DN4249_c0_g1_i1.p1  ORF type:complete len:313 (+),score=78.72 TRINITY_DN4249_c0_g1_i1:16-954(+)
MGYLLWLGVVVVVTVVVGWWWSRREVRNFKGKTVLITGAGSGIGRLQAKLFASEAAKIVIWDIRDDLMKETEELLKKENKDLIVKTYIVDLSKKEMIYDAASKVKEEVGIVDVLVNNAGIVTGKTFLDCTDAQIQRTIDVNIMAHMWTLKCFLPDMVKQKFGHIITIASAAGVCGVNGLADYCASKFAAVGFDESIRLELRKLKVVGVKTTLVCPFYINTGMFEGVKTLVPFILPILEPDYVAKQILWAAKAEKAVLFLPGIIGITPLFRALLPTSVVDYVNDLLGISSTMDEFKGRGTSWASKELEQKKVD